MDMKIQSDALSGGSTAETSRVQDPTLDGSGGVHSKYGNVGHAKDSIAVSGLASRISELTTTDQVRAADRVSQLAALYARGEYRPDAAVTSRAMVSRALTEVNGGGEA
jgi:hypothetical protein